MVSNKQQPDIEITPEDRAIIEKLSTPPVTIEDRAIVERSYHDYANTILKGSH